MPEEEVAYRRALTKPAEMFGPVTECLLGDFIVTEFSRTTSKLTFCVATVIALLGCSGNVLRGQAKTIARQEPTARTSTHSAKNAIVQVVASKRIQGLPFVSTGTGFVVAPGDLVVTASHVVTERQQAQPGSITPDGSFTSPNGVVVSYLPDIRVKLNNGREVGAKPITKIRLQHALLLQDYCVLRMQGNKAATTLELGAWNSMADGDDLTAWGFPLGLPGPVLIKASVALKHEQWMQLEERKPPEIVRILIFQGPNNKGMSGGPVIHARSGKVVGVVSTRLVGIGEELAKARAAIAEGRKVGSVSLIGVDPLKAILGLIEVLDQFLMSGMGSAIPIDPVLQEVSGLQ